MTRHRRAPDIEGRLDRRRSLPERPPSLVVYRIACPDCGRTYRSSRNEIRRCLRCCSEVKPR